MSEFIASPTMENFMLSDKYVRVLAGPIGGGKSVCCAHDLMRWSCDQRPNQDGVRKTRFLIVRNTADQLKSTTLKTIIDWFPPEVYGKYSKTDKTLFYTLRLPDDTLVQTEWMLIALDTPDDVRKALSLEATGLWGNESRELHPEVVDGLIMRVNRYPSSKDGGITRAGAIFDTNYPDEESWWEKKMIDPPRNWSIHEQPPAVIPLDAWIEKYRKDPPDDQIGLSAEDISYAIDPECDNFKHLERDYYPNTIEGKTEDFIRVYLRCQFGRSMGGMPVYEATYKVDRHENQKDTMTHIQSEQYPLCIGLDFGRTPAAIICQLTPRGTIMALTEVTGENMGIETFLQKHLKPHLSGTYPGMPCVVAADPAGWGKSQNDELCPADIVEREGFRIIKPPTNKPNMRIEAVETVLQQSSDAEPRLKVNRACHMLVQGFRGKYRWKTDRKGDLLHVKEPDKNDWSHIHDAFQYAMMVIDGAGLGVRLSGRHRRREVTKVSASGWV